MKNLIKIGTTSLMAFALVASLAPVTGTASAAADVGDAVDIILSPCQPGYDTELYRGVTVRAPTDGVYWVNGELYHSGDTVRESVWSYNLQAFGVCAPAVMPKAYWGTYSQCLTCYIIADLPAFEVAA